MVRKKKRNMSDTYNIDCAKLLKRSRFSFVRFFRDASRSAYLTGSCIRQVSPVESEIFIMWSLTLVNWCFMLAKRMSASPYLFMYQLPAPTNTIKGLFSTSIASQSVKRFIMLSSKCGFHANSLQFEHTSNVKCAYNYILSYCIKEVKLHAAKMGISILFKLWN